MRRLRIACLIICAAAASASTAKEPTAIPAAEIVTKQREVKDLASAGIPEKYVIEGRKNVDTWAVVANRIIFKSGSVLVFSESALARRNEFFIVAEEIVNEDPENSGSITWTGGAELSITPPIGGHALGGAHGNRDGESGSPGILGAIGSTGYPGRNAPSVSIFVRKTAGGGQFVSFRGQSGGQGGEGQTGGVGGIGHKGSPASASMFDCKSGAGRGGNGGNGGAGGTGGTGGQGGAGGSITLVSLAENLGPLSRLYRVEVDGGQGGPSGTGGDGGVPGSGGSQGEKALPYCKDEPSRAGHDGTPGVPGQAGAPGRDGIAGDFFVTGVTAEQFDRMLHGDG